MREQKPDLNWERVVRWCLGSRSSSGLISGGEVRRSLLGRWVVAKSLTVDEWMSLMMALYSVLGVIPSWRYCSMLWVNLD